MKPEDVKIIIADESHISYVDTILSTIEAAAKVRGTGIAKRSPEYIAEKINGGKAVVALDGDKLVGFSYIESWSHGDFVATSGLIVDPEYRRLGLASRIKKKTFELARERFPYAKLFSITTSLPVMKLNTALGYVPVTLTELTQDDEFWKGCEGCKNYDILQRNNRTRCLCTGMLFDPKATPIDPEEEVPTMSKWQNRLRKMLFLKNKKK